MAEIYAYLDLDGVEGESQDAKYQKKIEVQSFSWGAVNHSSFHHGTGSGIGKGQIQDITVSKFTDHASLQLFQNCTTGKVMSKGKLTLLKLQGETKIPYLEVELTHPVVTSFQISGNGNGDLPMEHVTVHFQAFKSKYQPQGDSGDPQGNVDFGWDIQQNAPA